MSNLATYRVVVETQSEDDMHAIADSFDKFDLPEPSWDEDGVVEAVSTGHVRGRADEDSWINSVKALSNYFPDYTFDLEVYDDQDDFATDEPHVRWRLQTGKVVEEDYPRNAGESDSDNDADSDVEQGAEESDEEGGEISESEQEEESGSEDESESERGGQYEDE
jgi:hypothetical protein